MARHHERDRVFSDRGADRARRLRAFDLGRDVRIADRAAHRDFQQRLPHPHLEVGADQDHAQRLVRAPEFGVEDALRQRGRAGAILDIGRARPAPLHVGERGLLLAGIGEGKAGEAAAAGDHDRGAERRGMKSVTQRHAGAAVLPFARRHRLMGDEQIVQPSRARKPGVEGGVEHAGGIAQQALGVIERQRLHEGLWRQPGPAAKQMVQLIGRDAGGIRHRFDGRLRAPVLRDEGDGAPHRIIVAQRGVLGARLGEAVIIHGEVHHGSDVGRARRPNHPIPDSIS